MFHLIHLSDLHLSTDALVAPPKKSAKRQMLDNLQLALQETKHAHPSGTWLVAVTGDIFETATTESQDVEDLFDLLLHKLDAALDEPRVVLLPGNHDARAKGVFKCRVPWPMGCAIPALRRYVDRIGNPRVAFYAKQGPRALWSVNASSPAHLAAYDSTYLPYGQMSAGGMIRREELLSLFPELQDTHKPLVLMLHHHLIPTPVADFSLVASPVRLALKWLASNSDYEEVMQTALGAGSALSTLQMLGRPVLVLHGHKHYPCVRLLSGTPDNDSKDRSADVLILAAGGAGIAEEYRPGNTSPLSIWPSFNHIQLDEQSLQAHCVAYPFQWKARPQDLSRRLLADMVYTARAWQPRPSTGQGTRTAHVNSGPRLAKNESTVTILRGSDDLTDIRKSFRVDRSMKVSEGSKLYSYREGIDCSKDAVIRPLQVAKGKKTAKLLRQPSLGVVLCVGKPAAYEVLNGLFVSAPDFINAHDKRDAAFESAELLNRYQAEVLKLVVCNLLSQYELEPRDCFASLTDLTLGTERPIRIAWDGDRAEATVKDCPPRHRLRIYWPLKSRRATSVVRRWWLAVQRAAR